MARKWKTAILYFFAILMAGAIWLPCLHLFYRPDPRDMQPADGISPIARKLVARHLAIWTDPHLQEAELRKMQDRNPEWDFMSRTFFVLTLANMAIADAEFKTTACDIIDAILEETGIKESMQFEGQPDEA